MGRRGWRGWLTRAQTTGGERAQRLTVLAGAAVVFALGIAGWAGVDGAGAVPPLSPSDLAYRSLQLFVLTGGETVASPPLALNAARFLAPLVTGTVVLSVLLSMERNAHRLAARTASAHVVAIGPAAEVAPYIAALDEGLTVVHAVSASGSEPGLPGAVIAYVDAGSPTWMRDTGAGRAAHILIATGSDGASLRLLEAITADESLSKRLTGRDGPPLKVTVEITGRSRALVASLQQVATDPARAVDIVCRLDAEAGLAVDSVVDSEALQRPLVVVGDAPIAGPFVERAHQRMVELYEAGDAKVAPALVLADNPAGDGWVSRFGGGPVSVTSSSSGGVVAQSHPFTVVVLWSDSDVGYGEAFEWAYRRPQDQVWCLLGAAFEGADQGAPADLANLNTLDPVALSSGSALEGPWVRLARSWHEDLSRRDGRTTVGWAERSSASQEQEVRWVRGVVSGLLSMPEYRLVPADGSPGEASLPAAVVGRLTGNGQPGGGPVPDGFTGADLRELPRRLAAVDIKVVTAATDLPLGKVHIDAR